jgi:Protein of unknown function (DUF2867)
MRMWMSDVREVAPRTDTRPALSGAQFSDAFSITVDDDLDARHAAQRMMLGKSWWIDALLVLRNIIVAPFGLKDGAHKDKSLDVIGIFPVVSETPDRLVAGFDDKHLDFRVVVDVSDAERGRAITATTLVMTHNLLGRAYLAIIMPFHKIVVKSMLRRVAG